MQSISEKDVIDAYRASKMQENADGEYSDRIEDVAADLMPEDIVIRKFNINMGMKTKNPLETVSFYREVDGMYKKVTKEPGEISLMMAERCQATIVRCFLRDESKFEQAKEAFLVFCRTKLGGEPLEARDLSHSQSVLIQQQHSQTLMASQQ